MIAGRRAPGWRSTVIGLLLVAIYLFPIYWMITASVKTRADIYSIPPQIVPATIDFSTWQDRILDDPRPPRYVRNSFIIATGTMALTLALAAPAAYALARLPIRGKGAILMISLSSLMFPAIMLATPLFIMFSRLGLTDSHLGLILADTTLALPYGIVLLRPTFASIPSELSEAALIDGCNIFSAFRRIVLPLARPGLVTVGVLAFLWGWGDLVFALTLNKSDHMRPVTTGLWAFFGANTTDWAGAMAFSTLAMAVPLVVFLLAQRQVVAGLTSGGMKG